jgi:hypothetical protein
MSTKEKIEIILILKLLFIINYLLLIIMIILLILLKTIFKSLKVSKQKSYNKTQIEILFETNDMYKLIGSFLEFDSLKLRSVCKNWKNKKVICKTININSKINEDVFIQLGKILNCIDKTNVLHFEIDLCKIYTDFRPFCLQLIGFLQNLHTIKIKNAQYINHKMIYFLKDMKKLKKIHFNQCFITQNASNFILEQTDIKLEFEKCNFADNNSFPKNSGFIMDNTMLIYSGKNILWIICKMIYNFTKFIVHQSILNYYDTHLLNKHMINANKK